VDQSICISEQTAQKLDGYPPISSTKKGQSFKIVYQDPRILPWMMQKMDALYAPELTVTFGLERKGEIVSGVAFDHYNGASIAAHICLKNKFSITKEFLHVCFDYAFNQAKVKKVLGFVNSTNKDAQKFNEHIGFKLEAVIKNAMPDGDLLFYTMTKDQFNVTR